MVNDVDCEPGVAHTTALSCVRLSSTPKSIVILLPVSGYNTLMAGRINKMESADLPQKPSSDVHQSPGKALNVRVCRRVVGQSLQQQLHGRGPRRGKNPITYFPLGILGDDKLQCLRVGMLEFRTNSYSPQQTLETESSARGSSSCKISRHNMVIRTDSR